ncbi:MAG: hypothetical protein MI806_01605 [Minwuiales bacterium]|nr:hypothetical protein [Minwuiales bacterium]
MITDEDWKDLPDDVELAFVVLDDRLWAKVLEARKPKRDRFAPDEVEKPDRQLIRQVEQSYVGMIKGFVDESGIDLDTTTETYEENWDTYFAQFRGRIEYFKTRIRTRAKMAFLSKPDELVKLSEDYREEIHSLLNRVRKVVHASDLEQSKKDVILQKINELNDEVDQRLTKLGRFKAAWLEITEAIGEGADNLKPAVEILERVGGIFGKARNETDPAQLPPPATPKQLPGPGDESD